MHISTKTLACGYVKSNPKLALQYIILHYGNKSPFPLYNWRKKLFRTSAVHSFRFREALVFIFFLIPWFCNLQYQSMPNTTGHPFTRPLIFFSLPTNVKRNDAKQKEEKIFQYQLARYSAHIFFIVIENYVFIVFTRNSATKARNQAQKVFRLTILLCNSQQKLHDGIKRLLYRNLYCR